MGGEKAGARGGEEEAECHRRVFTPATCAILRVGEGALSRDLMHLSYWRERLGGGGEEDEFRERKGPKHSGRNGGERNTHPQGRASRRPAPRNTAPALYPFLQPAHLILSLPLL